MDEYRLKLIMSYLYLQYAQEDLISRIINLGMAGVYKDISNTFSKNEKYVFEATQFRGTDDLNLNLLLDVYDEMDNCMGLFLLENDITDEEITEVLPEWLELQDSEYEPFESYEDSDDDDYPDFDDFDAFDRLN